MKKALKFFIFAALAAALLVGCADKKNSEETNVSEKAGVTANEVQKNIESAVTVSNYITGSREDGTQYYAFKSDLFKEYNLNLGITIGTGMSTKLPASFPILKSHGWNIADAKYSGIVLKPAATTNVPCEKEGKLLTIYLKNTTENETRCSNCAVNRIKFDLYSKDDGYEEKISQAPAFSFENGINNDTDMKGIISIMGEPSDVSYLIEDGLCTELSISYQNVSKNDSIKFGLTPDGAKITSVDYSIQ